MIKTINDTLDHLVNRIGARPTGSEANDRANRLLEAQFIKLGYQVTGIDFDCLFWEHEKSFLQHSETSFPLSPGPLTKGFEGTCSAVFIESITQLKSADVAGKILVLSGSIAAEPIMPKDFPFFYPDEHKSLIETIESKKPAAIIAATGKHPFCGWSPFPLFEDGNFNIPNAYTDPDTAGKFAKFGNEFTLSIQSCRMPSTSRQVIAIKQGQTPKKIVVCAHMDTKYGTPGALDNATGVVTMLLMMEQLSSYQGPFQLEFIPFNGEEYFGVNGQLAYLDYVGSAIDKIALVINIDLLGHKDGKCGISLYNFEKWDRQAFLNLLPQDKQIVEGEPWVAGDHSIFSFRGIPCMVAASSNMMDGPLDLTHTVNDTLEAVNPNVLIDSANFLSDWIRNKV